MLWLYMFNTRVNLNLYILSSKYADIHSKIYRTVLDKPSFNL